MQLALDKIKVEPGFNPRKEITQELIDEKKESLKRYGLLGALIVRPCGDSSDNYYLVGGEIRYLALSQLSRESEELKTRFKDVLVRVVDENTLDIKAVALEENLGRAQMKAIDVAAALSDIKDKEGLTNTQLADKLGKSNFWVSYYLSPMRCCEEIRSALESGHIDIGHCQHLAGLAPKFQIALLPRARSMTVTDFKAYLEGLRQKSGSDDTGDTRKRKSRAAGVNEIVDKPLYSRPPKEVIPAAALSTHVWEDTEDSKQLAYRHGLQTMALYIMGKLKLEDIPTNYTETDEVTQIQAKLKNLLDTHHKALVEATSELVEGDTTEEMPDRLDSGN